MICILRYMLKVFWGDHKEDFDFVLMTMVYGWTIIWIATIIYVFPIVQTILKYITLALGVVLSIAGIMAILRAVVCYMWWLFKEAWEHCE